MSAPRVVEFAGTDAELEKLLADFAASTWGRAARSRGGWLLSFGSLLSTNPNDLSFRIRVTREGTGARLRPSAIVAPWSRAKAARIIAFRESQLAAHLAARGTRPADPEKFREPFASWGSGPAALTAAFAWVAAIVLGAFAVMTLSAFAEWEEWVNMAIGLWLIASPWLLGFMANTSAMWTHVVLGICTAALSAWAVWDFRHPHSHA